MNKILDFLHDIYDYFFYVESIQERRFNSDYDLLRIKFIADNYSLLADPSADVLIFKSELAKEARKENENGDENGKGNEKESERENEKENEKRKASYAELCRNVVNLLHPSNRHGKRLDTDSKFKLLNVARREQILVYSNFECDTRIKQILVESSKLDAWRKEAILQLLSKYKDKEIAKDPQLYEPVKTSLYEAAYIRDVHFDNLYYKSKLAKRTIGFLNRVLVVLLLTILSYSAVLEFGFRPPRQFLLGPFSDLWLVVLFGLLGAAFSTLLNLYNGSKLKNTIIKQLDAVNLTFARLIIGACAGLIVFLILNSGLITIKGFNDAAASSGGKIPLELTLPMLSLIFVAGFTERLVLNFIEKLSAQADNRSEDDSNKVKDVLAASENGNASNPVSRNGKPKKDEETAVLESVAGELANKIKDDNSSES